MESANTPNTDKPWLWKPGQSGNPSGRPKGTLKDYVRAKFIQMTDEEKEEFLGKIQPDMQWRMGEGNPKQDTDITSGGKPIILPVEIIKQNDPTDSGTENNS
jgi:hypothetical protein